MSALQKYLAQTPRTARAAWRQTSKYMHMNM